MKNKVSQEELDKMGNFKPLPKSIVNKLTDPMEYIPEGNERIGVIYTNEILSDRGNFLWSLSFEGDSCPCLIRKSVVAYYWPFEASLHLKKQVCKNAKIKRLMEKIEMEQE